MDSVLSIRIEFILKNFSLLSSINFVCIDDDSDFLKNQGRKLSVETIYNYLKALENAFIISKVQRYDIKGKSILETQEKYYLTDLGLRHAKLGYQSNDISGYLENIVFLELSRRKYKIKILLNFLKRSMNL